MQCVAEPALPGGNGDVRTGQAGAGIIATFVRCGSVNLPVSGPEIRVGALVERRMESQRLAQGGKRVIAD